MTATPVLPEQAAYGIKSEYGFDQKNGHRQLIGVSVGRPGSWAGARVVELYTAAQMHAYALTAIEAAIAAAQATQPTDAERLNNFQITEEHVELLATLTHFVPANESGTFVDLVNFCLMARAAIAASKGAA